MATVRFEMEQANGDERNVLANISTNPVAEFRLRLRDVERRVRSREYPRGPEILATTRPEMSTMSPEYRHTCTAPATNTGLRPTTGAIRSTRSPRAPLSTH